MRDKIKALLLKTVKNGSTEHEEQSARSHQDAAAGSRNSSEEEVIMVGTISKNASGEYWLHMAGSESVKFYELSELLGHAESINCDVTAEPFYKGYVLGEIVVAHSEAGLDLGQLAEGLVDSTDAAYAGAVRRLSLALYKAADRMEEGTPYAARG